ncbi:conserved membrane hypothetical protein [Vibrio chagasii]|nr:conserved membrane hypothetical protein [Vibrio chagasii]
MNYPLTDLTSPLLLLIPLWVVLIKAGSLIKGLNKGRYRKRQLILIDAIDTIRMPLILITLVQYGSHAVEVSGINDQLLFSFLNEHLYFFVSMLLVTHIIMKFSESVRRDLISLYVREELTYSELSRSLEKTKVDALAKITKGVWIVLSIILILDHFGVPASSILAVGGMGSLIIGFAAKDILSDVLSGLLLYFDQQFNIGDWIKIEQPFLEGTVESIGWRVSKIKTFDNRPVYVPNKFLGTAIIQNVSRRESMRFKEYVSIDLSGIHKVNEICTYIRESILINHDDIDTTKPVIVNLSDLNGGVANIYISAHTNSVEMASYYNIKQDIWLKIVQVFDDNDVVVCASIDKTIKDLFE